jgi:Autographiviridae RNA polymerase
MDDLDRSLDSLLRREDHRAKTTGRGTTQQARSLVRQYREQLADKIGADRTHPAHAYKDILQAIKRFTVDDLAERLLVAGISASEPGDLGADKHGKKNFRDQALWIGRNLGCKGELGVRAGVWGINHLLSLPVFGLDTGDILKMTALADDIMDEALARAIKNNAILSPLMMLPEPWTQVRKGGLPADHWARVPLIRERHCSIENAARNAIGTRRMQRVLDAINALQAVPFTINEPILDFKRRSDVEPPHPGPKPDVRQRLKLKQYVKALAQRTVFATDIAVANAMAAAGRFWVPLNTDFRGRIYGIPHFNFQREDDVRALFLFADGEPIGEEGLKWLKAHVAARADGNAWSNIEKPSKLDRKGRIAWTDANLDTLRSIGEAVLRRDEPAKLAWALPKSDRYQFLAACVELVQALNEGPDFITRLPITFDGTCSGLQHLCAMTRADEGRYVNLVPADEADDFYSRVAFRTWLSIPENLRDLMEDPFDRANVKQPAMSYFYGSRPGGFGKDRRGRWRPYGMTKQIIDVLEERKKSTKGAKQLAHAIYEVIEDMVPRAKAVLDFLRKLTKLCANEGKLLRWTTPLGLPVINACYQPDTKTINAWLDGRRRRVVNFVVGDTDEIAEGDAVNAAAANFVHSVDACHLHLVALAAEKEGIQMVSVHDSFGCLAPRAERFKAIIHEQFSQLHERNKLLDGVLQQAKTALPQKTKLPPIPETGTLKLKDIPFFAFK